MQTCLGMKRRIVLEPHPRMFPPTPPFVTYPPTHQHRNHQGVLAEKKTAFSGPQVWFHVGWWSVVQAQPCLFCHLQWCLHAALGGDQDTSIRIPCIGPLCGYMLEQWTMFTVIYRTKGDEMGHAHLGHIEYPSEVDEEMPPNRFLTRFQIFEGATSNPPSPFRHGTW